MSKEVPGIAAVVALAASLATTGSACANASGTQIEYKARSVPETIAQARATSLRVVLEELLTIFGL